MGDCMSGKEGAARRICSFSVGGRVFEWRLMAVTDLKAVNEIADIVHLDYPEDPSVFEERQRLFPAGCLTLLKDDEIAGYIISHPWVFSRPPKLNQALEELPSDPDTYYIHDIALLEGARGSKAASRIIEYIEDIARSCGLFQISLISVGGALDFWKSKGFCEVVEGNVDTGSYVGSPAFMRRHIGGPLC